MCTNTDTVKIDIISSEAARGLRNSKYRFIYIGLIVIGIKDLTTQNIGAKTLLIIYDNNS